MLAGAIFALSLTGLPVYGQSASSSAASSSVASSSVATSSAASAASSGATSSSVAGSTNTEATALTFSLTVTNPTAIPLASITANETSLATIPLPSTATPGATNTFLSGAPALPNRLSLTYYIQLPLIYILATSIVSSNYPTLDKVPPTDSDEVQQWIAEVAASGISIPNITQTVLGGCPANAEAAADTSRCWWSCTGCVRDTDVQECPTKLTWGLTYDDGPSFYTPNLLTYLSANDLSATFFTIGSRCAQFPVTLQEEFMAGHQIAVHTWSHPYLTTLTNEQVIAELGWTKKVIKDVTGVTPNMMRPPYGDIDDRVRNISIAMGLTPVMWTRINATATFDTDDFDVHGGLASSYGVLNNWQNIISQANEIDTGFIVLEHDLFEETVQLATGYILPSAMNQSFDIKPVINCLNKPLSDAYIETNDNSTNPPAASGVVTLSSGAPGSASATGAASSSNSGVGLKVSGTSIALTLTGGFAFAALFL